MTSRDFTRGDQGESRPVAADDRHCPAAVIDRCNRPEECRQVLLDGRVDLVTTQAAYERV
jgi:hypothetical protein